MRASPIVAVVVALAFAAGPAAAQVQPGQPPRPPAVPTAPPKSTPAVNPMKPDPMKVRVVRSDEPGCEPHCPEWIAAQGQIDSTTPGEFRRVLARLGNRKLPIFIDSVGGSVDPSLTIGRMIRAKALDVVVTKTVIGNCAATDAACRKLKAAGIEPGRAEARISKCASSCAFILAGGVRRYVGAWTVVGLHEIKSVSTLRLVRQHYRLEPRYDWGVPVGAKKTILKEEVIRTDKREGPADEKTYDKIRAYFTEMGVAQSIMIILRSAPHSSIRWVRLPELKETGLATDFVNGEQLLAAVKAATAAPVAATSPAAAPAVEPSRINPAAAAAEPAGTGAAPSVSQPAGTPPAPASSPIATSSITPAAAPAAETARPPAVRSSEAKPAPKPKAKPAARPTSEKAAPFTFFQ